MRRAIKEYSKVNPKFAILEDHVKNGVGFIFTTQSFQMIKDTIDKHCIGSPAKVGAISPVDIIIPPMKTGIVPTQVGILHALGIQSKSPRMSFIQKPLLQSPASPRFEINLFFFLFSFGRVLALRINTVNETFFKLFCSRLHCIVSIS
jgi:hypothetical protein